VVKAGGVTRLEKIILFRVRPNLKKISETKITDFWFYEEGNFIYYADYATGTIFKMDAAERRSQCL